MRKRLYRSRTNKMLFGVCGGLGDYFDIDPAFVRVAFVLLAFANGIGIIAYIVLTIIVPKEPETVIATERQPAQVAQENVQEMGQAVAGLVGRGEAAAGMPAHEEEARRRRRYLGGIILVVLGAVFLLGNVGLLWWWSWGKLWPVLLIALGLAVIWMRSRR